MANEKDRTMANFPIDYEGKRYWFRYRLKAYLESTLKDNAETVEDITGAVAPASESRIRRRLDVKTSEAEESEGTPIPPGTETEPDGDTPKLNNGESSKGAKDLAAAHNIDLAKVDANGGKVNRPHVEAHLNKK